MDQTLINLFGGAALAVCGWLLVYFIGKLDRQGKELADLKVHLAGEYVTHPKLNEMLAELRGDLRYIRERLDDLPRRRKEDAS